MNNGSVESLKWSTRCGLSPKVLPDLPDRGLAEPGPLRHLRAGPVRRVRWRGLQGCHDHVFSTWSTLIVRGRPGRSSSSSPSRRCSMNHLRHLPTVAGEQRSCSTTVLLSAPAAHASTIFDRSASAWAEVARRASRVSCSRSQDEFGLGASGTSHTPEADGDESRVGDSHQGAKLAQADPAVQGRCCGQVADHLCDRRGDRPVGPGSGLAVARGPDPRTDRLRRGPGSPLDGGTGLAWQECGPGVAKRMTGSVIAYAAGSSIGPSLSGVVEGDFGLLPPLSPQARSR